MVRPTVLNATDLNNQNPSTVTLDFEDYDVLKAGKTSLGRDHEKVLCHDSARQPVFDYMLGKMFIQVSVSTFDQRNKDSASIERAFQKGFNNDPKNRNQIECYLDETYGPTHTAEISNTGHFEVRRNGIAVTGFRIIYIHGTPGRPSYWKVVKALRDVAFISYEEIKEKLLLGKCLSD
ncbi:hypothetical protein EMPS_10639 [Entomortierella parvispora]|uniref:Uncharacterized protein n=1 Tax=Entomortierella parvispora TaxID=205924 RepID=A0A9P3M1Q7_9FUNG|nr:hypothetical protein EMPS_10639 [Entomortierella parvispora]